MLHDQEYPQDIIDLIGPKYADKIFQGYITKKKTREYMNRTNNAYAWKKFNALRKNENLSLQQIKSVISYLNEIDEQTLKANADNGTYWIEEATNNSKEEIDEDIDGIIDDNE